MTRSAKLALGVAGAAAIMLVGGLAYAAIPDANQVIHGCYNAGAAKTPNGTQLNIVDGTTCKGALTAISWGGSGAIEGVNSTGTGSGPPATLTPFQDLANDTASTFTTTKSGKLSLSKPFSAILNCEASGSRYPAWYWIQLDGTPIRASAQLLGQSDEFHYVTLVGVTDGVVAAGQHTMAVGAMCIPGADPVSWGRYQGSAGTAIVLG